MEAIKKVRLNFFTSAKLKMQLTAHILRLVNMQPTLQQPDPLQNGFDQYPPRRFHFGRHYPTANTHWDYRPGVIN